LVHLQPNAGETTAVRILLTFSFSKYSGYKALRENPYSEEQEFIALTKRGEPLKASLLM
jgi:hypothetical protein